MTDGTAIRKNMIWNVMGSMIFVGAQWAMTILIVRLSGYDAAGWLSLGLSLTNIATNVVYFGIRNFQVSDALGKYSDYTYIRQRLVLAVVALVAYAGFVLANGYGRDKSLFLILFMVYRLSEPLADVFHGIDQKAWRLDIAGMSYMMRGFLGLAGFVVVLKLTGNLIITTVVMILLVYPVLVAFDVPKAIGLIKESLSCGDIGIAKGNDIVQTNSIARPADTVQNNDITQNKVIEKAERNINSNGIKQLTVECFPLFLYAICLNSVVPIPRYYLEKNLGSEILGFYSSAAIPASIIQMLSSYIYTTFTGLFSTYAAEGRRREFLLLMERLCVCIVMLGLCACGACMIPAGFLSGGDGLGLGDWGLRLLFTESIAAYTYLLVPTIISCIVIALVWFLGMLMTVLRDRAGLIAGAAAGLIASLVISPILVSQMGIDGVNPTIAISSLVSLGIMGARVGRSLKNMGKEI